MDKKFENQGLKFIFLMRVCLLVSFGISNFILGGTAVRFLDYAVGSIGVLFQVVFYVCIGTTISGITEVPNGHTSFDTPTIVAISVSIVIAIVGVIFVGFQVKLQLEREAKNSGKLKLNFKVTTLQKQLSSSFWNKSFTVKVCYENPFATRSLTWKIIIIAHRRLKNSLRPLEFKTRQTMTKNVMWQVFAVGLWWQIARLSQI